MLTAGGTALTDIGASRFPPLRYFHPRPGTPGKTYVLRAGLLEDVWSFDPEAFGLSPREAAEIDPQQRLVLELSREALQDAGLTADVLADHRVGVFVGASSTDHSYRRLLDLGSSDNYLMTGNTLSLIANRVSYLFNFKGPSFVVDTACSSSLVALHEAVLHLERGDVDIAVVAGVNILLTPFPFIGFSAARMLSPEGLCRAFGANGQGYVRGEGGAAFVVVKTDAPLAGRVRSRADIIATGVNSDGRTVGISLPSGDAQAALLTDVYAQAGVDPDDLAFVEAHGTGTRVGDPAEALALGRALGQRRRAALPIGSIKSNIGHLEPAAGAVGLLKAILALENDVLPRTLHAEVLNPDIDFAGLNLRVAQEAVALPRARRRFAGVSTFGFGGTNAHVIIADPRTAAHGRSCWPGSALEPSATPALAGALLISAQTPGALAAMAGALAEQLAPASTRKDAVGVTEMAAAVVHHRDLLPERLFVDGDVAGQLRGFAAGQAERGVVRGRAVGDHAPVALVFSGNGSQWAGMGVSAYCDDATFREAFDEMDPVFRQFAGWSLVDTLVDPMLPDRLADTTIAQPLLFAIQAAATRRLRRLGLEIAVCLGHSVGEIAAVHAAGLIGTDEALRLVHQRSLSQAFAFRQGEMAALHVSQADALRLLADIGAEDVEIAAVNSATSVTLAAPVGRLADVMEAATARGARGRILDIAYPFHSRVMDGAREALTQGLGALRPSGLAPSARATFVSTVTGTPLEGEALGADYWWENVRRPVLFQKAVEAAFDLGARVFVEIGPRPVLRGYLEQVLAGRSDVAIVGSFARERIAVDELGHTFMRAVVHGAAFDAATTFGPSPGRWDFLPLYPWQRQVLKAVQTSESLDGIDTSRPDVWPYHPLLGWQTRAGGLTWHSHIDTLLFPFLDDHRVAGNPWLPAAAFLDMALAAVQRHLNEVNVEIRDLDIVRPMVLGEAHLTEARVTVSPETQSFEIAARKRLSDDPWERHASGRFSVVPPGAMARGARLDPPPAPRKVTPDDLYGAARAVGLDYGPAFRRLGSIAVGHTLDARLTPASADVARLDWVLDPTAVDGALQALLALICDGAGGAPDKAWIPVRITRARLAAPQVPITHVRAGNIRHKPMGLVADIELFGADDRLVASLTEVRFAATELVRRPTTEEAVLHECGLIVPLPCEHDQTRLPPLADLVECARAALACERPDTAEPLLLLEAATNRTCFDLLARPGAVPEGSTESAPGSTLAAGLWELVAAAGLVEDGAGDGWRLVDVCPIPDRDRIVETVLLEHPAWAADCALLGDAALAAQALLAGGDRDGDGTEAWALRPATLEHFLTSSPTAVGAAALLDDVLRRVLSTWPADRSLRVLQLGAAGLALPADLLQTLGSSGRLSLCVCDADENRRTTLVERSGLSGLTAIDPAALETEASRNGGVGPFDLVVIPAGVALDGQTPGRWAAIKAAMTPGGALIAGLAAPRVLTHFLRLVRGAGARLAFPLTDIALVDQLTRSGWLGVQTIGLEAAGEAGLLLAAAQAANVVKLRPRSAGEAVSGANGHGGRPSRASFLARHDGPLARALATGVGARLGLIPVARDLAACDGAVSEIVLVVSRPKPGSATAAIAETLLDLRTLCADRTGAGGRLWIVAEGGARGMVGRGSSCPVATAVWLAARVVQNEHPELDIRLVDFDDGLSPEICSHRLAAWMAEPGAETELVLTAESAVAYRVHRGLPAAGPARATPSTRASAGDRRPDRLVLETDRPGRLSALTWRERSRAEPGPREVEIAVEASGLNFRDVMWSLGLLPPEALEDGFAGPSVGFECAGRIVARGRAVQHLEIGDPVIAMAPSAFASHVTVDAAAVLPRPIGLSAADGATIPVAFLTAYYALVHLGRLAPGETVLVHGAAGAVGLAALQIARWQGAEVIATAGTREKRELLRILGARHVASSRSLSFVDEIGEATGNGVDVVLNSLSGEAAERSLELVRPFGRFLELGKRDFYQNTKLGLRPFRRNVSYFGIDVDQLLTRDAALVGRLMQEIASLIESRQLFALPRRVFPAADVHDALRLMQQAGHIGKVVVEAPRAGLTCAASAAKPPAFAVDADGAHLVIGGLGGFGSATAAWLAAKGARRLYLLGRSGRPTSDAQARIAAMSVQGCEVHAIACDVTDVRALERVLKEIRGRGAPIRGVVHAAMVISDGALANMDRERIAQVLAPKVEGASHLDLLTRGDRLNYFVLFSSATTRIGNPGQAAYVAANGFLEGLAVVRRQAGKPALAVAWGAIADTGFLARAPETATILARRSGVVPLAAADAFTLLDEALARTDLADPCQSVVTIAPINLGMDTAPLATLRAPRFATIPRVEQAEESSIDTVRAKLARMSPGESLAWLVQQLAEVVASVLRSPASSIEASRPLAQLGMDSLMGLELGLAVEKRLGARLALGAIGEDTTTADLAANLLRQLNSNAPAPPDAASDFLALAKRHTPATLDEGGLATGAASADK